MAESLVVYTIVHQPTRLKLPAQPIPDGASPADMARCLFDSAMDERYFRRIAERCYHPGVAAFRRLVDAGAFKLCIGFSESALDQMAAWDAGLLAEFTQLVRRPGVELVCVEPRHSFLAYMDIRRFVQELRAYRDRLEAMFGVAVRVSDTTEMCMSDDLYFALAHAGFHGGLLDGRPWVMEWRRSTQLYKHGLDLCLLPRHTELSDDVGYRFSDRTWSGFPLMAPAYADWIARADGDFVFIGWDFETFGEHHWRDTGIFQFLDALPAELRRRGVTPLTASEAIARYHGRAAELPLPAFGATWAGDGGMGFFLGNTIQQALFQLMHHAYNKALLTGNAELIATAMQLMQSDVLHLTQWYGRSGDQAQVSAYFTPREWWDLGPDRIVWEIQQVYKYFIRACDPWAIAAAGGPAARVGTTDADTPSAGRRPGAASGRASQAAGAPAPQTRRRSRAATAQEGSESTGSVPTDAPAGSMQSRAAEAARGRPGQGQGAASVQGGPGGRRSTGRPRPGAEPAGENTVRRRKRA